MRWRFTGFVRSSLLLSSLACTAFGCATGAAAMRAPSHGSLTAAATPGVGGRAARPPQTVQCASIVDPRLLDAAARAVRIAPVSSRVWPGFHIPQPAILIYRSDGQSILVSGTPPSKPFTPVSARTLPRILRGRTYVTCDALPGLNGNFNTNYAVGNVRAVAVSLDATTAKTVDTLFHESFHKFQDSAFSRTIDASSTALAVEKRLDPAIVSKPEFVASMELERRILAQIVKSGVARSKALLCDYLAVRRQRRSGLPLDVRDAELNIERKEGSASIVGSEMGALATGANPGAPSAQLRMFMSEPPASLPSGLSGYGRFRARAFGSGAAIAWILTRLHRNWRAELEHGASFETLLTTVVGRCPSNGNLDAIPVRFGYSQLLADAQKWHEQYGKEASREDFYRTGPVRLIIEFPKLTSKDPQFEGEGTGLPSQPEDNIIIFMESQAFSLNYGPILMHADNHPYLLDLTQAPRVYRVEMTLDELPRVEAAAGADKLHWTNGGTIEGHGVDVKLTGAATLSFGSNTLTVRVDAAR
jgi:hypothetical protein